MVFQAGLELTILLPHPPSAGITGVIPDWDALLTSPTRVLKVENGIPAFASSLMRWLLMKDKICSYYSFKTTAVFSTPRRVFLN
jgi:hypothetical protein